VSLWRSFSSWNWNPKFLAKKQEFTVSHCRAPLALRPPTDAAKCVEHCVSGGATYVLVSAGKVYKLDAQAKFKGLGGKSVKVTGALNGDTLKVSAVAVAAAKS
jgi:Zn-dependent alcohol dehydrogenase